MMKDTEEVLKQVKELKSNARKDLDNRIKEFVKENVDIESMIDSMIKSNRDTDNFNCSLLYNLGLGILNYYLEMGRNYVLDRDKLIVFLEGVKFGKWRK